jgi:exodeoxyribonuclease-3
MTFSIATWNINSVRLRMPIVERLLAEKKPDILCLQETKCMNDQFPYSAFRKLGYENIAVHGQKGYHGVATVSLQPIEEVEKRDFCEMGDTRHLSVKTKVNGFDLTVHNFYVPAGGDEPDPEVNPKFAHKLAFVDEMHAIRAEQGDKTASILVGDLNIAPLETDVWSHKQLLNVVSHTPVETEGLEKMRKSGGWHDLMRQHVPPSEKLYTWWSYRARDWAASDRGRRLDHFWSSSNLSPHLQEIEILREARGWEKPSDHVPVIGRFSFD